MQILFLNRFFFPDHSATSQMLSDLAFALAARGHDVEVITSFLTYDGDRTLKRRETIRGVRIVRLRTSAFGRRILLGRAIDYVTFYTAAFFSLIWRARRGTIVVAKTDPPMLSAIAVPVSWLKGARVINWLQDLYPEVAEATGMAKNGAQKGLFGLLRAMRNTTLRNARTNVVIGAGMARKLRALGVPGYKIQIIPNWASGVDIRPIARQDNALRKQWALEDVFVVGYSGNLGRTHEIETFLAAIEALEKQPLLRSGAIAAALPGGPSSPGGVHGAGTLKVRWLFIGGGAQMETLKHEVRKKGLKSVMFGAYQPRELLPQSLSLPDVHLISLRPEFEGLIVPSKYYGVAAAGRPAIFVGHPEGEIAQVIRQSASGSAVSEGDGAGLVRAVAALAQDPDLAAAQGARARALFEAKFDFPIAVAAWEKILKSASPGQTERNG